MISGTNTQIKTYYLIKYLNRLKLKQFPVLINCYYEFKNQYFRINIRTIEIKANHFLNSILFTIIIKKGVY